MATEVKSIQVIPRDAKLDTQVNKLAEKLRTSRSGLALLALETVVDALETGKAEVVNGEVKFKTNGKNRAA